MPSSSRISVTPVVVSPFSIADATGEGPRYFGSKDGCIFSAPNGGTASVVGGQEKPIRNHYDDIGLQRGKLRARIRVSAQ